MSELAKTLEDIGDAFQAFRGRNDERLDRIENTVDALDKAVGRTLLGGGGGSTRADGRTNTTAEKEHKNKFMAWARKGSDPDGLRGIEASLSTLSDPDGGYLVPIEIEKSIERLAQSSVALRRLARIVTSKGEYMKPLSKGGATGGWVAEKEARPETNTPELTLFSPPMNELFAMPNVTQKLLDMSDFDIAGWLTEEISDVFVGLEGTGFITGDGVGKPHGIIDESKMIANANWVYGKTGFVTSGHATLLNSADRLIDLQHALKPLYRANGVWLMNDNTLAIIRKIKDGLGNYIWMPGLMENSPDMLLGRPVAIDENMPDIGANAYPIAFGDWQRAFTIVDHVSGTRLLRDPFSVKGSVAFYVTKRLAAGCSNTEALKFLKIAV